MMEYISIIRCAEPYGFVPKESFSDVRLNTLLSDNVLEIMEELPASEDIEKRQQVFAYLDEKGVGCLEVLAEELRELEDVFDAYEDRELSNAKYYIFVALIYRISRFSRLSSELECGVSFFEDYVKQFKELFDPKMHDEAEKIYNTLFRGVKLSLKEDRVISSKEEQEGYLTALERCAGEMGITARRRGFGAKAVNAELADSISLLYPEVMGEAKKLYEKYKDVPSKNILDYIDQLDFYISNHKLSKKYQAGSMAVCYAQITKEREMHIKEAYDITLMSKDCLEIIPNHIDFDAQRSFFFLCGANGGGKTTYLRACGVVALLALNGCPVPARSARLPMLNSLLTHFPKDERFDMEGRFLDEQNRVEALLDSAKGRCLVLLNETYATTNEEKSVQMTCKLAERIMEQEHFCIYVTHQKRAFELKAPLLCCVVDENDENRRTYKIRPLDASVTSHAMDVLRKYSLSKADLEERFGI